MKKITSLILAVMVCFSCSVSALATDRDKDNVAYNESSYTLFSEILGKESYITPIEQKEYPTHTLFEYEMNLYGVQTNVKEKIFADGTIISTYYEYESKLSNEVKRTVDGRVYLDGHEVTIDRQIINSERARRVGSMLIPMDGPQPGVSYTKFCYTEHIDVNFELDYQRMTLATFLSAISYAYPPLKPLTTLAKPAIKAYFDMMKMKNSLSKKAFVASDVYTTETITNPQYQYFKYFSTYFTDDTYTINSGGTDITYCMLAPTV